MELRIAVTVCSANAEPKGREFQSGENCAHRLAAFDSPCILALRLERAVPDAVAALITSPRVWIFAADGGSACPRNVAVLWSRHIRMLPNWFEFNPRRCYGSASGEYRMCTCLVKPRSRHQVACRRTHRNVHKLRFGELGILPQVAPPSGVAALKPVGGSIIPGQHHSACVQRLCGHSSCYCRSTCRAGAAFLEQQLRASVFSLTDWQRRSGQLIPPRESQA